MTERHDDKSETPRCTEVESGIDSNDARAWRTLAYKLEHELAVADAETSGVVNALHEAGHTEAGTVGVSLGDVVRSALSAVERIVPYAYAVESEYERMGRTVNQRDLFNDRGDAERHQADQGGKLIPLYAVSATKPNT